MIDFCTNAVNIYGKTGDQSLECIGFNFTGEGLVNLRIYRQRGPALMAHLQKEAPYSHMLGEILQPFCQREHIHLCDVSPDDSQNNKTYRVMFKLPRSQSLEETTEDVNAFFACFPGSEEFRKEAFCRIEKYTDPSAEFRSPLFVIGAEFNENCELQGAKYYMRLSGFDFLTNIDRQWRGRPEELCRRISHENYKPAFVGINDFGDRLEEKLYFTSKSLEYKRPQVLEKEKLLVRAMGWEHIFSDDLLTQFYDMGLNVGGFAFSLQSDLWRVYFRECMGPALPRAK